MQEQRKQFVEFQLGKGEFALLPAKQIIEIKRLKVEDIVPVPQLPSCILGVCQWRGNTLWLIDLGELIRLSPLTWSNSNFILVLLVEEKTIGLVVPKVKGINYYDIEELLEPSEAFFNPELIPYLEGFFLSQDREIIRVLKPEAIIQFDSRSVFAVDSF
ncbi:MAG: chemotaxis protein CheW [Prochloraceae cyanobacterium]|nr:chemotaxis protein CheW [Prochloraceae cyanobacterium]